MGLSLAAAGSLALAGCQPTPMAKVTGSEGGMLPGMERPDSTLTSAQAAKLNAPQNISQATEVRLPDGGVRVDQTIGGVLYSQAWYNSGGVPQHSVIYADGHIPQRYFDYTEDGRMKSATTWYPGTAQPQRVEEYNDEGNVASFTEYWPNGKRRIVSESDVETPAGPAWRVQEWYENGLKESVAQHDADGLLEGRQTAWDKSGNTVFDASYSRGVLQTDYLKQ
jgi:antitoxin component YwqK of YwqJK toxin-antitoxin module